MSYIVSWSGGKDSSLAYYKAIESGYDVSYLVNFVSEEYNRVRFHGTEAELISLQAESIGAALLQRKSSGAEYEDHFKQAVRSLIPGGVEGMVFGDIYLAEHREWVEKVCGELGIEAVEPLWGEAAEEVLRSFIDAGFEAVVVSARGKLIEKDWIGRRVDRDFMEYLKSRGMDVCGEKGEYHTVVIDGPIFKRPIEIVESRTVNIDGYWFLDTLTYRLAQSRRPQ